MSRRQQSKKSSWRDHASRSGSEKKGASSSSAVHQAMNQGRSPSAKNTGVVVSDRLRGMRFMKRQEERDLRHRLERERELALDDGDHNFMSSAAPEEDGISMLAQHAAVSSGVTTHVDGSSSIIGSTSSHGTSPPLRHVFCMGRRSFGGFNAKLERLGASMLGSKRPAAGRSSKKRPDMDDGGRPHSDDETDGDESIDMSAYDLGRGSKSHSVSKKRQRR